MDKEITTGPPSNRITITRGVDAIDQDVGVLSNTSIHQALLNFVLPGLEDLQAPLFFFQWNRVAVFECAGVPSTIGQSVSLVRRGGTVSLVGVANNMAEINPAEWLIKEVKLTSSIAYQHEDFEICKDLVASGRIQAEALHTSTTDLAGMSDAFDRLSESPQEVKILVDPR